MKELLRTNDAVLLSYVRALMTEAGIDILVADEAMSAVEGSLGILPRRVLVAEDEHALASTILRDAGALATEGAAAPPPSPGLTTTDDAFLGGRLHILQPVEGLRAGLDAVLLAAAAPVSHAHEERVLDAGSGVGVVALCLARRCERARVVAVEVEPELARLAELNAVRNRLSERVEVVEGDITRPLTALTRLGLAAQSFDHVLANPPYLESPNVREPAGRLKARASAMEERGLERWTRFLAAMAKPQGTLTLVHRADALPDVLSALSGRFGGLRVLPIHPRAEAPAHRILVHGRKASRAPLTLLPGLVVHDTEGRILPPVDAVLRQGVPIVLWPPPAKTEP